MIAAPVGTIASDLSCLHCGYNLRGLTGTGRCPECGKPVLDTLRGTTLHRAAPATLLTMRNGLLLLIAAGVFVAAAALCSDEPPLAIFALGAGGSRSWLLGVAVRGGHGPLVFLLTALALGFHVAGIFAVTTPRGLTTMPVYSGNLGYALRLVSIVSLPLLAASLVKLSPIQVIALFTVALVEIGQSVCCLLYLHELTRAAGFAWLTRGFRVAMWLSAGRLLVFVPIFLQVIGPWVDVACGLSATVVMSLFAWRLNRLARENRPEGINDRPPAGEPANPIG